MLWRTEIQPWNDPALRTGLRGAQVRKLNLRLRAPHTFSFSMNGLHPLAGSIQGRITDAIVSLGPLGIFRGRCNSVLHNVGETRHGVNYTFVDYRGLLQRRRVYASDVTVIGEQAKTQQAWINALMAAIQGRTNGNYGIVAGATLASSAMRTWTVKEGQFVGSILQEMSNTTPTFDWEVDSAMLLNAWVKRGALREVGLMYGKNVATFSDSEVSNNFANDTLTTGSEATVPVPATAANIATAPEGRWDAVMSYPDISVQDTLAARSSAVLANASKAPNTYVVTLKKGVWEGPAWLNVGDTIDTVRLKSGPLNVLLEEPRVLEIALDIDDKGGTQATLTLEVAS